MCRYNFEFINRKTKRFAKHFCICLWKVIPANLVPNWSVEHFSSSRNWYVRSFCGVCHISWVGQSVFLTNIGGASNNNVFIMLTIADRSIWTLIKACFISRTWNIVHQNWLIDSIRKINLSYIWQVSYLLPANSTEYFIKRSAENIGGNNVEIMRANGSPLNSIIKLSSSLKTALIVLVVIHSKSTMTNLRNQRCTLGLEIFFKTWLICESCLCICTGEWCCQKEKYFLHFYKIFNNYIN